MGGAYRLNERQILFCRKSGLKFSDNQVEQKKYLFANGPLIILSNLKSPQISNFHGATSLASVGPIAMTSLKL